MGQAEFDRALKKKFGIKDETELSGIPLKNFLYARNSNRRGKKFVELVERNLGIRLKGKRILDVGCAYGGFCLAVAEKGALAYGVEIQKSFYDLAVVNAENVRVDGQFKFILADASSFEFRGKVPNDFFDLIIVHDVFEHVYDTVSLLENLALSANHGCLLYFMIPNGRALRFVKTEGHNGLMGISLLDPSLWQYRIKGYFNIYYRPWAYFVALFNHFGFQEIKRLNYEPFNDVESKRAKEHIRQKAQELDEVLKLHIADSSDGISPIFKEHLRVKYSQFRLMVEHDLERMDASELKWKYDTDFWEGIATFDIAFRPASS